jgi:hypothetical protein
MVCLSPSILAHKALTIEILYTDCYKVTLLQLNRYNSNINFPPIFPSTPPLTCPQTSRRPSPKLGRWHTG